MTQQGVPERKSDHKLSTYVDPEIKEAIEELAKKNQRTVAGEIRVALISHIESAQRSALIAGEAY
jgi:predicted transcriptional regulator